jgi:hypothetical protein
MVPLDLTTGVRVQVRFYALLTKETVEVLVVEAKGETGVGSASNADAIYIEAMAVAGLISWSPSALVFDFRELTYEWGDHFTSTLSAGRFVQTCNTLPTAVVVSGKCREGFESLISDEMFDEDPSDWLFQSLEAATSAVLERPRSDLC